MLPISEFQSIKLDPNTRRVIFNSKTIQLRKKEFDLLELLLHNPYRVFTRISLLELIWGYNCDNFSNTVDVHISTLRKKLDRQYIQTIYGRGYRLASFTQVA